MRLCPVRHVFRLTLMTLIVLLVACKTNPSTLLQDTTCLPPCWKGITPGQSTKREVLSVLPTWPEVDIESIEDYEISTGGRSDHIVWKFDAQVGDRFGGIYFEDDVVSIIAIRLNSGALTFADAMELLGEPEGVLAFRYDTQPLAFYLLYPSKGYALLDVVESVNLGDRAVVEPERSVLDVFYINSAIFEEAIGTSAVGVDLSVIDTLQPWEGFGEYDIEIIEFR